MFKGYKIGTDSSNGVSFPDLEKVSGAFGQMGGDACAGEEDLHRGSGKAYIYLLLDDYTAQSSSCDPR